VAPDLLDSGPERPPPRGALALARLARLAGARSGAGRGRRVVAVAASGLLGLGLVAGLRAGMPAPPAATYQVAFEPPYDTLPGRVRIPTPWQASMDGRVVEGLVRMPPGSVEWSSQQQYDQVARMVLGRYCRQPADYAVRRVPEGRPTGAIVVLDRRTGRFFATIVLYPEFSGVDDEAPTFRWRAWLDQLHGCS